MEIPGVKIPGNVLTVVIRNEAPLIHCNDCPSYRSVQIELTEDQVDAIALRPTHQSGRDKYYEEISRCFIEPAQDAEENE